MRKAPKLNTDSAYDFLVREYGDMGQIESFLYTNSLESIEAFDLLPIGYMLAIPNNPVEATEYEFLDYRREGGTDDNGRDKKQPNQNLMDYVLTHYGSLEFLGEFVRENGFDTIGSIGGLFNFETQPVGTKFSLSGVQETAFTAELKRRREFVATNADFGSLDYGDYSQLDYNIDYR